MSFNLAAVSRKYHKWLMLFLGLQFLIWSVTGAYMVLLNIDYIHGDSLVVNHQDSINHQQISYPLSSIYRRFPEAQGLELGKLLTQDVYRFSARGQKYLMNARTGELLPQITKAQAKAIARYFYNGDDNVIDAELITANPPSELSSRRLPAWRVNFDAFASPSLYVSSQSGLVVTKRHEFWRTFDLFFRLHIMDYGSGEEVDNWLLFWSVLFGLLACISGILLVYYRLIKPNIRRSKPRFVAAGVNNGAMTNSGGNNVS